MRGRWLSRDVARIDIEVSSADSLIMFAPPLHWKMSLTVDATDLEFVRYEADVVQQGWPAVDLFVDCERVYFRRPAGLQTLDDPHGLRLPPLLWSKSKCTRGFNCNTNWCGP